MLSAGELLAYAARQLTEDPNDPVFQENQFDWINTVKDWIVSYGEWKWLQGWSQVTASAGGILYFPDYVWQVASMFPSNFGYRRPVQFIGGQQFDQAGPGLSAGLADYCTEWGYYGIAIDNPSSGTITVTSSAAAGDNGMEVTIEGLDTTIARNEIQETVTLAVLGTATTTQSFQAGVEGVRRIYVHHSTRTGKTQGLITATRAGTELVRIHSSRELHKEHIRAELYPSSVSSYVYRFYRRVRDVIDVDQLVEIPRDYKDIFYEGLKWQIREFQGFKGEADSYRATMSMRLDDMKWKMGREPARRRGITPNQSYRYRAWRW